MSQAPLVVLTTGGTGGHMFPAEALALELKDRGCRLALITDRRGAAYKGALGEVETHSISAGGIAGKGLLGRAKSVVNLGIGSLQARSLLKQLKPACVVGFGGYASVPTMMAATWAGLKTAIHEQNALLGRANRLLASRVDRIATSFEIVRGIPEAATDKIFHTGMPVRPGVAAVRGKPYPTLDSNSPLKILVLGGSQGAHIFSEAIPAALAKLPEDIQQRIHIAQQCRPEDLEEAKTRYEGLAVTSELKTFFDDVPERLVEAHLVIARSGASTVAELTAVGRPAILVPYPFAADDHQSYNAHAMDEAGGGWLMPQDSMTPETLANRIESLFGLPQTLEKAAAGAIHVGRPDAAARLADMVMSLLPNGNGNHNDGRAAA